MLACVAWRFGLTRGKSDNNSLNRQATQAKCMPTKHELDWNNICENDSLAVTSRLYENTGEKITQFLSSSYICRVVSQLEFTP